MSAVKWCQKAAELGHADAQFNLGAGYDWGRGVRQDMEQAVEWYQKAAAQGLAGAQCSLGTCYAIGEGVRKDTGQAVGWFRKAAEQGGDAIVAQQAITLLD